MTTNNYFRGDAVKKVWLNRYPADVPAEINPDRYQSLVELFEHATTVTPTNRRLSIWVK